MAVKLEQKTDPKKVLKIISVIDSAIDWDESYPNPEDFEEEEKEEIKVADDELPSLTVVDANIPLERRKKEHYSRNHDISKLRFKINDEPTLFVFAHPHRVDVAKRMRELASNMYSESQKGKKEKVEKDIFTAVFHNFYLGTEQGFAGNREPVQKVNYRIPDNTIQAFEDAEIFLELNNAFMRAYNEDKSKIKDKDFSEK